MSYPGGQETPAPSRSGHSISGDAVYHHSINNKTTASDTQGALLCNAPVSATLWCRQGGLVGQLELCLSELPDRTSTGVGGQCHGQSATAVRWPGPAAPTLKLPTPSQGFYGLAPLLFNKCRRFMVFTYQTKHLPSISRSTGKRKVSGWQEGSLGKALSSERDDQSLRSVES